MKKQVNILLMFIIMFLCGILRVSANQIAEGHGLCKYKVEGNINGKKVNIDGTVNNGIPDLITVVIDADSQYAEEMGLHGVKLYNGEYNNGNGDEIISRTLNKLDHKIVLDSTNFINFEFGNNKIDKCPDNIYAQFYFSSDKNTPHTLVSQWFDEPTNGQLTMHGKDKYVIYSFVEEIEYEQIKTGSCIYKNCTTKDGSGVSGMLQLEVSVSSKLNGYYMNTTYKVVAEDPGEGAPDVETLEEKLLRSGKPACPAHGIFSKSKMWFSNDLDHIKDKSDFDTEDGAFYCTYSESDSTIENRDEINSNREQGITTNPSTNQPSFHIGAGNIFNNCDELFGNGETISLLRDIFKAIIIVVPILIITLSVLDFIKATAASDEKAIKEAQSKFIKRLIIAALIVFLPIVLNIILNLLGNAFGVCDVA